MRNYVSSAICLLLLGVTAIASAQDQYFDSDGVQIRYVIEGEGEPLVLIHGFTASIETNWKLPGIFAPLAKEYKVIALDCRGHGKSGKPHDRSEYGAKMSKDVANLLDHLDIEEAHIAGYSMGGMITLHFLINYPDRCTSAIVGGMGWNDPATGGLEASNAIAESLEKGEGLKPLILAIHPEDEPLPSDEEINAMSAMILAANDAKALAAVAWGFSGLAVTKDQLSKNTVPTLAVVGEIDPLRAAAEAMEANMPNVEKLVLVPGGDHITAMANPVLTQAMLDFLAEHAPAHTGGN